MANLIRSIIRIMYYDHIRGLGLFRIVKKSIYRWYRFGWDGMLEWLDKEIWKIPNPQTVLEIDTQAYHRWIKNVEPKFFKHDCLPEQKVKFSLFLLDHTISEAFTRTMPSIQKQIYTNWEIIQVVNWDEALSYASGEWGIIIDNSFVLSHNALSEIAVYISDNSDMSIVYSDDDSIDSKNLRSAPHFKSSFNPDMFYSMSYIGKSFAWNIETVRKIDGLSVINPKCWEYDLLLRIWEAKGESSIHHISKILFHQTGIDTVVLESQKNILLEHFERQRKDVVVDLGMCLHTLRVRFVLPKRLPKVSIIIPTRDHIEVLHQCIESILHKTDYPEYEIIVVNNQSMLSETLDYFDKLSKNERISVLEYDNVFNYSAINNFAVTQAKGEIIVLMNNDTEVITSEWLGEMVSHAIRPEIGCVGAMLYYPDDTIQHAGVVLGLGDVAGHAHKYMKKGSSGYFNRACVVQNFSAVTAACLAIRKELYTKVNGLDEQNLLVAYNDVDLCLKVQEKGYRNLWTPYAQLYHHESKSRGKDDTPDKKARYLSEVTHMHDKWRDILVDDPCYNRAFSRTAEQFQLRRI